MKVELLNCQLNSEYLKYIDLLTENASDEEKKKLSLPLLMNVFPDYLNAKNQLLVIGQESKGWEGMLYEKDKLNVEHLVDKYKNFKLGRGTSSSQIFRFCQTIYETINPNLEKNGFLWTSISKLSYHNGKGWTTPSSAILQKEKDIVGFNLLLKEIQITKPNVVVFATGKKYLDIQQKLFPGIKKEIISLKTKGLFLNKLKHNTLPENSFETNNPGVLRYVAGKEIDKCNDIASNIKQFLT